MDTNKISKGVMSQEGWIKHRQTIRCNTVVLMKSVLPVTKGTALPATGLALAYQKVRIKQHRLH